MPRSILRARLLRDGEPGADPAGNPSGGGNPPAPADPPRTDPPPAGQPAADPPAETDWKAEARKWEKLAKENRNAATELEKLRKEHMTDQEKAVAEAEAKGRTAAAKDYGTKLAKAEFKAAVAAAGVDLGDAADLIDATQFVDDQGEVDEAAIKKAVAKLAKLAPKPAGASRSGGEFPGGTGAGTPITEDQLAKMSPDEITKAYGEGKLKHLL